MEGAEDRSRRRQEVLTSGRNRHGSLDWNVPRWSPSPRRLWLGILTSISPCPLATNIAAISYIGRRVGQPPAGYPLRGALHPGPYARLPGVLGVLLVASVLSVPQISMFLQRYMNKLLGPLLILVAMFLLDLIQLRTSRLGTERGDAAASRRPGPLGGAAAGRGLRA